MGYRRMSGRARLMSFISAFGLTWTTRNFVQLDDYLSRTIILHLGGMRSHLPLAGDFEGRAAVIDALQAIEVEFELLSFRIHEVIGKGEKLAVRWSARLANRGSGSELATGGMAQVSFVDGRVEFCAVYADTAALASLMGWAGGAAPLACEQQVGPLEKSHIGSNRCDIEAFFLAAHEQWHEGRYANVVRAHFHPRARLRFAGSGLFPAFSGTHIGHEAIIAAAGSLMSQFERVHGHIDDILVEGNRVSVRSSLRLRHRETSLKADTDICDAYVMNLDGEIVDWVAYCDTGLLAQLAQRVGPGNWD